MAARVETTGIVGLHGEKSFPVLSNAQLEAQFRNKRIYKDTEYVDIIPENRVPKGTILFGVGWSENPTCLKPVIFELVKLGYRVLSLSHSREEDKKLKKSQYNKFEERKARSLLNVAEASGTEGLLLVARSEGGINGVMAAHIAISTKPELFQDIVLESSAGLHGNIGFWEMFRRFRRQIKQSSMKAV